MQDRFLPRLRLVVLAFGKFWGKFDAQLRKETNDPATVFGLSQNFGQKCGSGTKMSGFVLVVERKSEFNF